MKTILEVVGEGRVSVFAFSLFLIFDLKKFPYTYNIIKK
jgi:hypothetical protein